MSDTNPPLHAINLPEETPQVKIANKSDQNDEAGKNDQKMEIEKVENFEKPAENLTTSEKTPEENPPPLSDPNQQLIITEGKRGMYSCDYCKRDISQIPRIRCSECGQNELDETVDSAEDANLASLSTFDACLDCYAAELAKLSERTPTNNNVKIGTRGKSSKLNSKTYHNHDIVNHGYFVSDSTRFVLFPPINLLSSSAPNNLDYAVNDGKTLANNDKMSDVSDDADSEKNYQSSVKSESSVKTEPSVSVKSRTKATLVKHSWTVEEDLRLLDGIESCGLGNWVDIAEYMSNNIVMTGANYALGDNSITSEGGILASMAVPTSVSTYTKTPKRCMERYLDEFCGRFGFCLPLEVIQNGQIYPTSTMPESNKCFGTDDTERDCEDTMAISCSNYPIPDTKLYDAVKGKEVQRQERVKTELEGVKALGAASNKEEAQKIKQHYLAKHNVLLPPRPEDVRDMPGSEFAGYLPRRGDFDIEWENDAETILADMEFLPKDTPAERDLKMQIIKIYNTKLDERERRKKFVKDHGLLDYKSLHAIDKNRPRDEQELIQRMRLFARFHSAEEHKKFVESILEAKRLRKEIAQLQMYRRLGIRTLAEAEKYELDKLRRERHKHAAEENAKQLSQNHLKKLSAGWHEYNKKPADRSDRKSLNRDNNNSATLLGGSVTDPGISMSNTVATTVSNPSVSDVDNGGGIIPTFSSTNGKDQNKEQDIGDSSESMLADGKQADCSQYGDEFDISKAPGIDLLCSKEKTLCESIRLLPEHYIKAKRELIQESFKTGFLDSKSSSIIKLDIEKKDKVIEFVMTAGWIQTHDSKRMKVVPSTSQSPHKL